MGTKSVTFLFNTKAMKKLKSYPNRQIGKGGGNWRRAPKTLRRRLIKWRGTRHKFNNSKFKRR